MKQTLRTIPFWILYLAVIFISLMALFTGFRYALFSLNAASGIPADFYTEAFLLGLHFDLMVVSYLLAIPAVAFSAALPVRGSFRWLRRAMTIYFAIAGSAVLLACCADIPYYSFTGSRLNNAVFIWTDTPRIMLGFIFGNRAFYPYLAAFFLGIIVFIGWLLFLQKKLLVQDAVHFPGALRITSSISALALLAVGIRGGWRERPIQIRDAFLTNYPFVNMLPLNPVLTFFDSMTSINLDYVDEKTAVNNVRRYLQVKDSFDSPIARRVDFSGPARKPNIVLVLMESMSAEMTGLSSKKSFTPVLDSLAGSSLSFPHFYTCGIHTCNGLYGVLYSLPSVPGMHPLSNVYTANQEFTGIASVLKENGYSTSFFCTHFEEFDNMGFFLRRNGFENFYSIKEYSPELSEGMFGVSDETQYDFALKKFNALSEMKKPFFSALLTISTHEPPMLPSRTKFKPKSGKPFEQVYEYADWALGNFMKKCASESWFSNTIFVFVADHGCNLPGPYEIPLSYHHSPFILYSPALISGPKRIEKMALQEDVFPTLMGFLKLPYVNNTLGIDLLSESRPYAYFCKDYLVGCMNEKNLLVLEKFGAESLYDYSSGKPENLLAGNEEMQAMADSMKTYSYSMLETAAWLLKHRKLGRQH